MTNEENTYISARIKVQNKSLKNYFMENYLIQKLKNK